VGSYNRAVRGMKNKSRWKYFTVTCPDCSLRREMRADQYKRNVDSGRPFYCLPCGTHHRESKIKRRDVFDFSKLDWPNNKYTPKNPLYSRWQKMRRRCSPSAGSAARWYYNSGIRVDPVWQEYEPFRVWSLRNGFKPELELDRIDPYGDYSPKNCRWITHAENCRNQRPRGYCQQFAKEAA
jgi:hypothetical protein